MTDAKILIVDDMQENLILLDFALRPFEATVVKARSGFEAEAACLEDEFVLVIMDVHMPERDGIETADIIRKSELNALTPIIFLTADTTEAELPRSAYQFISLVLSTSCISPLKRYDCEPKCPFFWICT